MEIIKPLELYLILIISLFIALCKSEVTIVSDDDIPEVIGFNQYKAYKYVWAPIRKDELSYYFSYTVQSNDTFSVYLFTQEQFDDWNERMAPITNDTIITSLSSSLSQEKNSKLPTVTIEDLLKENEKGSINHLTSLDCPDKVTRCEKKECIIEEGVFYLVVFGYMEDSEENLSYSLFDVQGDFKLDSISLNGQLERSTLLNYNISIGKAYKTSFIGMTENDNEKEPDPEEEADVFKKMVYIAIIVIPSVIIFLLLLFVYCHRSTKNEHDPHGKFYHPREGDGSLRYKPYMEQTVPTGINPLMEQNPPPIDKGKKSQYTNIDNSSSTIPNDSSKLSILHGQSQYKSKGSSTFYNSMDRNAGGTSSNSISCYPYIDENEVPFKDKSSTKRLDLSTPFKKENKNTTPQANISIPYNMNHYEDSPYTPPTSYNQNSRDLMVDEKSEDIVNTSIGHVGGEEFDTSKNIYVKINRSTNKYNTEEYLKEDSINKIKEKHSCITQLSEFFNENETTKKTAAVVNDSSSGSTSSSFNEEGGRNRHHQHTTLRKVPKDDYDSDDSLFSPYAMRSVTSPKKLQ